MKALLPAVLLLATVLDTEALKCHTCVTSNMDECNRHGSTVCPKGSDACTTIIGPNSVMKSCSYKAFCYKASMSKGGVKPECCFSDDCNGPHHAHSHGARSRATSVCTSSTLLMVAVMVRLAASVL